MRPKRPKFCAGCKGECRARATVAMCVPPEVFWLGKRGIAVKKRRGKCPTR